MTTRVLERCPASLPPAIDCEAAKHLMTSSEYVRRSVIDRLKADGPVRCRLTVTYPMSREGEQNPTKFKPGQSGTGKTGTSGKDVDAMIARNLETRIIASAGLIDRRGGLMRPFAKYVRA